MMRERGFTPALNCFAQAWQAKSGSKCSRETGFVDKAQRRGFAADPACRNSAKMMVTMGFEHITSY
jgi:hypothetical protein